jgi:O-antigen ligase
MAQAINGGPLGLWGLGEIDRFPYETTTFYRAPGLSMHPNYLGGYLMITLFACAVLAYRNIQNRKWLILLAFCAGFIGLGLVATLSRSAMLSTVVGFAPIIIVLVMSIGRRARLIMGGVLVVVLAAAAIWGWLVLAGNVQARFLAGREFFFTYSFEVIKNSPVLGVGASNLMLEAGRIFGTTVEHLLPVHNVYLFIWAELGLPGLALFLIGCFSILRRLRTRYGMDAFIWTCCFLAICLVMVFDNYWWAVQPFRVLFLWVIGLGWAYACRVFEREAQAVPDKSGELVMPPAAVN